MDPTNAPRHRVLVIDDHPVFRLGVSRVISAEADFELCGEASSAATALELARTLEPHVAVVDISMPDVRGMDLIKRLKEQCASLAILVLSAHDEAIYAIQALRAGALGYIMKAEGLDYIANGIRRVAGGSPFLSPTLRDKLVLQVIYEGVGGLGNEVDELSDRELEVLTLMGKGLSSQETAEELHLSIKTIESHRTHIREKMNFPDAKATQDFATQWVRNLG
jgi:DNA-binding NarL/FixJ family response regulator